MAKIAPTLIYIALLFVYFCPVKRPKGFNERRVKMKAYVDPNACGGTGLCVDTCPGVFELDDDGMSIVRVDEVPAELQQACREAVDNCPTDAITIKE